MRKILLQGYAVVLLLTAVTAQTFEPAARLSPSTNTLTISHRYLSPGNPPMMPLNVEVRVWMGPTTSRPTLPPEPTLIGDHVPLELFGATWQGVPLLYPPQGTICNSIGYCGATGNHYSQWGGLSFKWIPQAYRGPRITLADVLLPFGFSPSLWQVYVLYYFQLPTGAYWFHGHLLDIS